MRILIVTHYCLPHLGGVETLSFTQSKELAKFDHDVTILSSKISDEPELENISNVKIIRSKIWNFLERRFGVPYPLFSFAFIRNLISLLSNTDICVIHSFGFMSSFLAAFFCKLTNTPYVLIQNNEFIKYSNHLLNIAEEINDRIFGSYIIRNAAELLAVSINTKEYINKLSKRNVSILNNCVDDVFFEKASSKKGIREYLDLPLEKFVVLTSGRLVSHKSVTTVLDVALSLKDDFRFLFLIVGDGPEKLSLEKFIQKNSLNNCVLLGKVAHNEMRHYYQASDIFLLTSRGGEGFPIGLLEAMASSLATILPKQVAKNKPFVHRKNGFVFDATSSEQITNLLLEYIAKPYELLDIAASANIIAKEQFSAETQVKKLECFLLQHCLVTEKNHV